MKSTMKSAFAFIAVAMMIMVAVVPMVSVFTESSDAAEQVIVDPEITDPYGITITVTVTDEGGEGVTEGAVKVTYKAGSAKTSYTLYAMPETSGSPFKITIQEQEITDVELTYVVMNEDTEEYEAVPGYEPFKYDKLTTGDNYTPSIEAGKKAVCFTLKAKNDYDISEISYFGYLTIKGKYQLYSDVDDDGKGKTKIGDAVDFDTSKDIDDYGCITAYYPASTTGDVYIALTEYKVYTEVSGTKVSDAITFSDKATKLTDKVAIEANENIVTVLGPSAYVDLTVESLTAGESNDLVTFKFIRKNMSLDILGTDCAIATTIKDLPSELTDYKIEVKIVGDKTAYECGCKKYETTGASTSLTLDLTGSRAFYGSVYMEAEDDKYVQPGTLKVTFTGLSKPQEIDVYEDGTFFAFISEDATAVSKIEFGTFGVATPAAVTFGAQYDIELDNDGVYAEVTGALAYGASNDAVAYKVFEVEGATVFGNLVTDETGDFGFMAKVGDTVKFVFDDDATYTGGISVKVSASGAEANIVMNTQTVTVNVADALGKEITGYSALSVELGYWDLLDDPLDPPFESIATFTEKTPIGKGVYVAEIRADLDPEDYIVLVKDGASSAVYTFDELGYEFTEGMIIEADQADYAVVFKNSAGVDITKNITVATNYQVYKATAYRNSLGSIVYTYGNEDDVADLSKPQIASLFAYDADDIGSTPLDVMILVNISLPGIFDKYYVLNADAKGNIVLTASTDSFSGKLVRNDGVTPIAGVEVNMVDGDKKAVAGAETAYTQNDGTFTIKSTVKVLDTYKLTFKSATVATTGYKFSPEGGYPVYSTVLKAWNTVFEAEESTYAVTFVDADGKAIDLTGTTATLTAVYADGTKSVATEGTAVKNVLSFTAKWDEAATLTVALAKNTTAERSFADVQLTADMLKTGIFTVTSEQKTYTFSATDANGAALPADTAVTYSIYRYSGDIAVDANVGADASGTVVLPIAGDKADTVYGYVAEETTSTLKGYEFALDAVKITDVKTVAKSLSALKTVAIQDAAGKAVIVDSVVITPIVTVYANDVAISADLVTTAAGKFSFVATAGVEYTYTVATITVDSNKGQYYTFVKKTADTDGVIKAKEETITGSVTDAAGKFVFTEDVAITVDLVVGNDITATQSKDNMSYSFVAEKANVKSCQAEADTADKYTFEPSATADIKANETSLPIVIKTANGKTPEAEIDEITVVKTDGTTEKKAVGADGNIIVDITEVSEYRIVGDDITLTSKDGTFVTDIALYEGSIGMKDVDGDIVCVVYKGTEIVDRITETDSASGKIVINSDDTTYTAYVDTTLGDKFVVTYTATVDEKVKTYSAVMNNTSKIIDLAEVVVSDGIKANIVDSAYIDYELSADGNKIYLFAAKSYTGKQITPGSTSSDGHDLIEKFRFDGWYVNGSKVSGDVNYTAENTEGNVIVAYYVSDGYYETNKPVEKSEGNNSSVMIIGIAAVIIALIAVVYAVIQKKQ